MRYYRVSVTNREDCLVHQEVFLSKQHSLADLFLLLSKQVQAIVVADRLDHPACTYTLAHHWFFLPVCTYAKGLSNQYCPSVSQFVSLLSSEKFLNLNIDRIKQFVKPTVALTL